MMAKEQKSNLLARINEIAAMSALAGMTVVVFVAVILRYIFSITFRWTDELTRFIFIYLVFLGIPIAFRREAHVVIKFFTSFLPSRVQKWLGIGINIAVAFIMFAIAIASFSIIFGQVGQTLAPGLKCPRAYIYAAVPIGVFFLVIEIVKKIMGRYKSY
ncbi:TRAP transporter small permease [Candidatus Aerophobetes bacterium]|nr:TRAP transporter small permease [Candidatus Aerophobetes bacterium]